MSIGARALALFGVGYGPKAMASMGLHAPAATTGGGMAPNKRRPTHTPMYWPPFYQQPAHPRRSRKRRQADILFLS